MALHLGGSPSGTGPACPALVTTFGAPSFPSFNFFVPGFSVAAPWAFIWFSDGHENKVDISIVGTNGKFFLINAHGVLRRMGAATEIPGNYKCQWHWLVVREERQIQAVVKDNILVFLCTHCAINMIIATYRTRHQFDKVLMHYPLTTTSTWFQTSPA